MGIIAVAGGSGDVGRTIVQELARNHDHEVFVLTRQARATPAKRQLPSDARIVTVHYDDIQSISNTLRQLKIDTVISALNLFWPGAAESQTNLIRAAAASGTVTRFVPSEFNIDYSNPEEKMPYPPRLDHLRAVEELRRHPTLTYTLVRNGFFMDYLGLPYVENTNLHPLYCLLDLPSTQAVIPGDGDQHVVFTHTRDVGKFVAALVNIPASKWPEESAIIGDRVTLNELVELIQKISGKMFNRSYDPVENIKNNIVTELPSNIPCYAYFPGGKADLDMIICTQMIGMAAGVFDIQGTELHLLFPDTQRTHLNSFLTDCWSKARKQQSQKVVESASLCQGSQQSDAPS